MYCYCINYLANMRSYNNCSWSQVPNWDKFQLINES